MKKSIRAQVDEIVKAFQKYGVEIENAIEQALVDSAMKVERTAKKKFKGRDAESIPNEPPRAQSGRARASINHRLMRRGMFKNKPRVEIGMPVDYAYDLEHGTSTTYPHPVLGPSLTENEQWIRKRIDRGVSEMTGKANRHA